MLTFGWEVGLALSFVRPVYHQVPEAAETVGDLICKKKKANGKKRLECYFHSLGGRSR